MHVRMQEFSLNKVVAIFNSTLAPVFVMQFGGFHGDILESDRRDFMVKRGHCFCMTRYTYALHFCTLCVRLHVPPRQITLIFMKLSQNSSIRLTFLCYLKPNFAA